MIKLIETWHKWAMNEQNAQAQKKLFNSMPPISSAATICLCSNLSIHLFMHFCQRKKGFIKIPTLILYLKL